MNVYLYGKFQITMEGDEEDLVEIWPVFADLDFDLVASHFDREFDLSIERKETFGEDYLREFEVERESIEERVNSVKSTISELCQEKEDRRKWRMHTQKTHLMGGLKRIFGKSHTSAFCKFNEILARFPELIRTTYPLGKGKLESTTFKSLHLCEIPGNFISALGLFLARFHTNLKWDWQASSLNPHYEYTKASDMFLDDELIVNFPDRWLFGKDNSGDVMGLDGTSNVDLVTADGSTYSQDDPERQESIVLPIFWGEIKCACKSLREGGSFVMKVYSSFTLNTCQMFALLMSHFKRVVIYKPPSSKAGNTERYLVCTGFLKEKYKKYLLCLEGGLREATESRTLTKQECERIAASCRFFSTLQQESMNNNIELFVSPIPSMQLNMLADRAIERAMRECHMDYHDSDKYSKILFDLFCKGESGPWKELFQDNLVERLKDLEDPITAEQLLRDKIVRWSMEAGTSEPRAEEYCLNDWSKDELDAYNNDTARIFVSKWKGERKIVHSLFIDPELWVAFRSLHPEVVVGMCSRDAEGTELYVTSRTFHPELVVDMCRDAEGIQRSSSFYDTMMDHFTRDERGFIQISMDILQFRADWIFLLKWLHEHIEEVEGVTLLHPTQSPSTPFLLSRFSASVFAFFTILFRRTHIPHPLEHSKIMMEFEDAHYREDIPPFLVGHLDEIFEKISTASAPVFEDPLDKELDKICRGLEIILRRKATNRVYSDYHCLSFAPLNILTAVYNCIAPYNNDMLKRVITENLKM